MSLWAPFLINAVLAALGVALAAAPLGAFVVWRRMAYFGDALAHGAVLGVALSLATALPVFGAVLAVTLALAGGVAALAGRGVAMDTALGVLSHGALAAGLVAVAFVPGVRVDIMAYLFGDVLAVGRGDLWLIWGGVAAVLGLVAWRWQAWLMASVDSDLAIAAGIRPGRERLLLLAALALVVAVAIKVVGALLITALLIIPAAAARPLARSPEAMAGWAMAIGAVAALGGIAAAVRFDAPAAPAIVALAAVIFALSHIGGALARK